MHCEFRRKRLKNLQPALRAARASPIRALHARRDVGFTPALPMNPEMVEHTPHPAPLPIGSADSADAEREKRTQRLGKITRRMGRVANARMLQGILIRPFCPKEEDGSLAAAWPARSSVERIKPTPKLRPAKAETRRHKDEGASLHSQCLSAAVVHLMIRRRLRRPFAPTRAGPSFVSEIAWATCPWLV